MTTKIQHANGGQYHCINKGMAKKKLFEDSKIDETVGEVSTEVDTGSIESQNEFVDSGTDDPDSKVEEPVVETPPPAPPITGMPGKLAEAKKSEKVKTEGTGNVRNIQQQYAPKVEVKPANGRGKWRNIQSSYADED